MEALVCCVWSLEWMMSQTCAMWSEVALSTATTIACEKHVSLSVHGT